MRSMSITDQENRFPGVVMSHDLGEEAFLEPGLTVIIINPAIFGNSESVRKPIGQSATLRSPTKHQL
jgi:hypothetical protein